MRYHTHFRVLALSATPGDDMKVRCLRLCQRKINLLPVDSSSFMFIIDILVHSLLHTLYGKINFYNYCHQIFEEANILSEEVISRKFMQKPGSSIVLN